MIDLVAVQALTAVSQYGTVAAAANALGYTPSAISQQVKRLEKDTGVAMVERVGRGVVLTEHGRLLVEDGRRLFGQLEAIESRLQSAGGSLTGAIRMASFATAFRGVVAPVIAELAEFLPELTVTVIEVDPPECVAMVAGGQADIAVIHDFTGVPLHRPSHVVSTPIGTDFADVLLPRNHRLAGAVAVTAADLADETWASNPAGSICHEWFQVMFARHDVLPRIRFWLAEYASQIELVGRGVAVALLPRLGRLPLPETVVAVPVRDPVPTRNLHVIWRDTMSDSPAVIDISSRLRRLMADR